MKCINIFGHKWSKWSQILGKPRKNDNGEEYSEIGQIKKCEKCDYSYIEWSNSIRYLADNNQEE